MVDLSFLHCSEDCREMLATQKKLLDFLPAIVCSVDVEGCFTQVTAAAKSLWGFEPEELVGRPYIEMVFPEDREKTLRMAKAIREGCEVTNFQNRYVRKDGTVVPVIWSACWDQETQTIYSVGKDATEKEEADKQAREYEQKLYRAYKLAKIGWWECDEETEVYSLSDELYEIFGVDKGSDFVMTRQYFFSLVHPDDLAAVKQALVESRRQQFSHYEHRIIRPSGEMIYVVHYVECVQDAQGKVVQTHGATKNITERKTTELALRRSEQRLSQILESIDDGFFAVDRQGIVTYWNRRAEEVLQRRREDMLGKNLWEVYQNDISLKFHSEYKRAIAENRPVHFEAYFPPLNIWLESSIYPSAEGLSVYFKNITDRKLQQQALEENIQRYAYATKATSDAIWDWDITSGTILWGEGFTAIFGYQLSPAESNIQTWLDHIHPVDLDRMVEGLNRVIQSSEANWSDEYRYQKIDGTYAFVLDKGFVIRNESGEAVRMVGSMQDITQKKQAELSMRLSEEQFRLLFYLSPKPKWMFNEKTLKIVEVNEAALQLYGYSKEEFLSLTVADLNVPGMAQELQRLQKKKLNQYQTVVRHVKKNGEVFYLEISTHAIDLPAGRHFIVAGDDLTEKMRLQQKLIEEKITAQKEVARAILDTQERERSEIGKELHDNVNQLLTTAKLYMENISYFPDQKEVFIEKGVSLLQRSIQEIRSLSKQLVTPVMNDIGFKATIDELISHYRSINLFEIELQYNLSEKLLDQSLKLTIYRIVQEQLNNIVKYAKASLVKVAVLQSGDELKVVVYDNGVGFDLANTSNGLGLKNMKNRAEVYKGSVDIQSARGKGSKITVRFPLGASVVRS